MQFEVGASRFWPIALAELHTVCRLARSWILLAASFGVVAYLFVIEALDHATYSVVSVSADTTSSRFILGGSANFDRALSEYLLLLFQVGIVALTCDIRARDIRERIVGVLDAKPISNFELIVARLAANVVVLTIAMAMVFALIALTNLVLPSLGSPYGTSMESVSVLAFLAMDLVPNLAFWGALTVLLAVLIRFRFLVLLLAVGLAGAVFAFTPLLPNFLHEVTSTATATLIHPSDLASEFTNATIVLQRLTLVLLAGGLLFLSSVFYPRNDRNSQLFGIAGGLCCLVLGVGVSFGSVQNAIEQRLESDDLAAAHESFRDLPRADVVHIEGVVDMDPGAQLDVRYKVVFKMPELKNDELIFAFNPGFEISSLTLDDQLVAYRFEKGLIVVDAVGLNNNETKELSISAIGKPDLSFGYLDSRVDLRWETRSDAEALRRLGYRNGVNNKKYVALTPALKWYPTAGAAFGEDDLAKIRRDQFTVDLQVNVPEEWIVAGPGSRQTLTSSDSARFRFAPKASVPAIALFGSHFVRRSINISGIECELLMSPKHTQNIELFSDAVPILEERLAETFDQAQAAGIAYPYELFSAVEVPAVLRVYGGGSRLDSVHGLPGIFLIRETGFPTAAFAHYVRTLGQLRDGQVPAGSLYRMLLYYFVNDFDGGNPYIFATRSFVNFQTSPTGTGAIALETLVNELTARILTDEKGFYSIYHAGAPSKYQKAVVRMLDRTNVPRFAGSYVKTLRNHLINRPEVWDELLSTPLAELDFHSSPKRLLNAFIFKTGAIADALHDFVSDEDLSRVLSELRTRHAGDTYTYGDFHRIAAESGINLDNLIGDWVGDTTLPGFQLYEPRTVRIPDDDQGDPVYQTTFYVSNEESTPGLARIWFEKPPEAPFPSTGLTPPILIDANSYWRVALHSQHALSRISLRPYLSLNRKEIEVKLEKPRSLEPQNEEKLPLVTAVDWRPPDDRAIVVDDLDEGFSIAGNSLRTSDLNRWAARKQSSFDGVFVDHGLDEGLPNWDAPGKYVSRWYRANIPQSFGKYRHASAVARRGGNGESVANFNAQLPAGGRWSLEYYFPLSGMESRRVHYLDEVVSATLLHSGFFSSMRATGTYSITVRNGGQSFPIQFDVSNADPGWNRLGVFKLEKGSVDVEVQDFGDMEIYADAIRWTPSPDVQ